MTYVVWIAIAFAGVVFVIFAGVPLYHTYKSRGQGADVAGGQAYLRAKAKAEGSAGAGPQGTRDGTVPPEASRPDPPSAPEAGTGAP